MLLGVILRIKRVCLTGGFYGAIWKYAGVILIAAPLFAATDFVEMRLVLVCASLKRWFVLQINSPGPVSGCLFCLL